MFNIFIYCSDLNKSFDVLDFVDIPQEIEDCSKKLLSVFYLCKNCYSSDQNSIIKKLYKLINLNMQDFKPQVKITTDEIVQYLFEEKYISTTENLDTFEKIYANWKAQKQIDNPIEQVPGNNHINDYFLCDFLLEKHIKNKSDINLTTEEKIDFFKKIIKMISFYWDDSSYFADFFNTLNEKEKIDFFTWLLLDKEMSIEKKEVIINCIYNTENSQIDKEYNQISESIFDDHNFGELLKASVYVSYIKCNNSKKIIDRMMSLLKDINIYTRKNNIFESTISHFSENSDSNSIQEIIEKVFNAESLCKDFKIGALEYLIRANYQDIEKLNDIKEKLPKKYEEIAVSTIEEERTRGIKKLHGNLRDNICDVEYQQKYEEKIQEIEKILQKNFEENSKEKYDENRTQAIVIMQNIIKDVIKDFFQENRATENIKIEIVKIFMKSGNTHFNKIELMIPVGHLIECFLDSINQTYHQEILDFCTTKKFYCNLHDNICDVEHQQEYEESMQKIQKILQNNFEASSKEKYDENIKQVTVIMQDIIKDVIQKFFNNNNITENIKAEIVKTFLYDPGIMFNQIQFPVNRKCLIECFLDFIDKKYHQEIFNFLKQKDLEEEQRKKFSDNLYNNICDVENQEKYTEKTQEIKNILDNNLEETNQEEYDKNITQAREIMLKILKDVIKDFFQENRVTEQQKAEIAKTLIQYRYISFIGNGVITLDILRADLLECFGGLIDQEYYTEIQEWFDYCEQKDFEEDQHNRQFLQDNQSQSNEQEFEQDQQNDQSQSNEQEQFNEQESAENNDQFPDNQSQFDQQQFEENYDQNQQSAQNHSSQVESLKNELNNKTNELQEKTEKLNDTTNQLNNKNSEIDTKNQKIDELNIIIQQLQGAIKNKAGVNLDNNTELIHLLKEKVDKISDLVGSGGDKNLSKIIKNIEEMIHNNRFLDDNIINLQSLLQKLISFANKDKTTQDLLNTQKENLQLQDTINKQQETITKQAETIEENKKNSQKDAEKSNNKKSDKKNKYKIGGAVFLSSVITYGAKEIIDKKRTKINKYSTRGPNKKRKTSFKII